MKSRTLQGGESYPSCLAGIGGQLRSRQFRRRRCDSAVNQLAIENKAELRREEFIIKKEFSL
jgi:hypothetical protein